MFHQLAKTPKCSPKSVSDSIVEVEEALCVDGEQVTGV